jgi:FKBP-type peptidyl-prolyl cis-trans isomerase FklB
MRIERVVVIVGCVAATWLSVAGVPGQGAEPLAPPAGTAAAATPADMGYALGYRIGEQIAAEHREMGTPIDHAALARGLTDAVTAVKPRLDEAAFSRALAGLEAAMQQKQREFAERMRAAAKTNLEKGAKFLADNAARKGVTTLPSGLQYEVLVDGAGAKPAPDHVVTAHYRGTHIDGSEFDGTDPQGDPASFPLRGVVPGWQEALPLMKAGSKWRIYLPPALGYGEQGSPPAIEPNEVLVFEIQLLGSRPAGAGSRP